MSICISGTLVSVNLYYFCFQIKVPGNNASKVSGVVLNGDLDYKQDHLAWKDRFQRFLGAIPFYVTVGNHDTWTWRDYQEKTKEHYKLSNVTECRGGNRCPRGIHRTLRVVHLRWSDMVRN